ncbi:hypothetical protein G3N30_03930 [Microbacterium lacticum]|uniref:hypothetical protein n=1 Tax=Microbacterium lacticum TaxID=33885 RepID=UPI0018B0BEB3|nr:hypothetical protein [Microbacterium lacticum]MBF9335414.1 hypothetical protein [Microbacterium lacticum]
MTTLTIYSKPSCVQCTASQPRYIPYAASNTRTISPQRGHSAGSGSPAHRVFSATLR